MSSRNILIVEDEVFVAMDLESILVGAGYHVVGIAADRTEALAAAEQAHIAFVDLNLRDGPTGTIVAEELGQRGIRIVYVTANPAQIETPARTAIGYIPKPFDEPTVVAAAALLSNDAAGSEIRGGIVPF